MWQKIRKVFHVGKNVGKPVNRNDISSYMIALFIFI